MIHILTYIATSISAYTIKILIENRILDPNDMLNNTDSNSQHLKAIFIWLAGKISAWLVKNFTYQPAWLVSEKVSFGP